MVAAVQPARCSFAMSLCTRCILYRLEPCIVLLRCGGLAGTWSRTKHFQSGRRERESPRVSCACNRAFDWAAEYSRTPRLSLVPLFLLALVSFPLPLTHTDFDASPLSTASLPTLSSSLQNAFSCISLQYFDPSCSLSRDVHPSLSLRLSPSLSLFLSLWDLVFFLLLFSHFCKYYDYPVSIYDSASVPVVDSRNDYSFIRLIRNC